MEHFEALIVGAGPAGSFAAELLARAGVKVALFDGRPEGEPKACGGGVTAKALKAWPHLLNAVGRTVDELEMYSPSGNVFISLRTLRSTPLPCYYPARPSRAEVQNFCRQNLRAGHQAQSEWWMLKNLQARRREW